MKSYLMKNEESGMKNFYLNKMFVLAVILFTTCVPGFADDHRGRLQIGTGRCIYVPCVVTV